MFKRHQILESVVEKLQIQQTGELLKSFHLNGRGVGGEINCLLDIFLKKIRDVPKAKMEQGEL